MQFVAINECGSKSKFQLMIWETVVPLTPTSNAGFVPHISWFCQKPSFSESIAFEKLFQGQQRLSCLDMSASHFFLFFSPFSLRTRMSPPASSWPGSPPLPWTTSPTSRSSPGHRASGSRASYAPLVRSFAQRLKRMNGKSSRLSLLKKFRKA